ncbi:BTAD domain-containing putative transcriptional regulator [Streptomyces sp. NPDC046881]|uniref:AfsR/SARP family transcriptional regulator n=1 Tax=Streptomyces sp. NPDC046881 TaxID=3155374 RepID=UPI00340780F9
MDTELGVLGSVEARVAGRPVDLGPARQRCVLAVLVVEANHHVPVDELTYRVWGHSPPREPRSSLYSYLSRLRRVLGDAEDVRLDRQAGGYLLTVDPGAVDLHRFRDLIARARAATDEAAAAVLFDDALGLWRGPAFGTLDTPWLSDLRDVLAQERVTAQLDRNDIQLSRGRHAELIAGLLALTAEHPLDERLAGQYMLALYRSGRPSSALAVYRDIHDRLAEELGTSPHPSLQNLHQEILRSSPSLAVSPAAPASAHAPDTAAPQSLPDPSPGPVPPPVPVAQQLPAPPPAFVGRTREIGLLDRLVDRDGEAETTVGIAAITGTGGVGKTCLALRWAHDNVDRFPDGHLYTNLRGFDATGRPTPPDEVLRAFLEALGTAPGAVPAGTDAQAGLYRTLTAGRRMLILLDNAHDTDQVLPLLPGGSSCTVVVTSRRQLTGLTCAHGARPLALDALAPDEARRLFSRHLGSERVGAEPRAATRILERCAGLPLAISILAARAAANPSFPLQALASELDAAWESLDAFDGGDRSADLRAVFSWSYAALDTGPRRLFRLLGTHPGPDIAVPAAAAVAGLGPRETRSLLVELARAHLVSEHAPGRYTLHDLLREYAVELSAEDPETPQALLRGVDHSLHTAHACDRLLWPHRDPITLTATAPGAAPVQPADDREALQWFETEHAVLAATVEQTRRAGLHRHTCQLAWALSTYHGRKAKWHDVIATQTAALEAATALDDPSEQAHAHRELGCAYNEIGQHEEADDHLARALELYHALEDHTGEAQTHLVLGWICDRFGDQREALHHDLLALELFQAAGYLAGQARALNAVGWDYAQLSEYESAAAHCREALAIQQKLGDRRGEANTWDSLGFAYQHLGDHEEAIVCYHSSLALNKENGHRFNLFENLDHLGDVHRAMGDEEAARDYWRQSVKILRELGNYDADIDRITAKMHSA